MHFTYSYDNPKSCRLFCVARVRVYFQKIYVNTGEARQTDGSSEMVCLTVRSKAAQFMKGRVGMTVRF